MKENPYVKFGGGQSFKPDELVLLEAEVNYTILHLATGKRLMVATTLKKLEARLLQFNFFRTHRSYLINMDCVKYFKECDNIIQMTDNQMVGVSRRKLNKFKHKILFENTKR